MSNRPTVRQLECLVAVADSLNFHRAARALALSQPALSAQVASVEELLGVQVFERTRRKVLLTPAGAGIVLRARDILGSVDGLGDEARRAAAPLTGSLRLGVIPTIAPYLLPRILPPIRAEYPALQLYLREDQTSRLVAQLAEGRLDVLLLALPVAGVDAAEMPLFADEFLLATPPDHALSRRKLVREGDLDGQEVLLLEDGHCLRDQALAVCRIAGAAESQQVQATSMTTLVEMVASGLGVTLLPALAAESARQTGIQLRRFEAPRPSRSVGLAWRRSSARAAEYRLLGEVVIEAVKRYQGVVAGGGQAGRPSR
jgi:LysR family transcriptional regulator, hydrogen peroxide-inducible genes activator